MNVDGLRTEEDNQQLACHHTQEHGQRIDRSIAHRSLVVLIRKTLCITQSWGTCHGTYQETYNFKIIDFHYLISQHTYQQQGNHCDKYTIQNPHISTSKQSRDKALSHRKTNRRKEQMQVEVVVVAQQLLCPPIFCRESKVENGKEFFLYRQEL